MKVVDLSSVKLPAPVLRVQGMYKDLYPGLRGPGIYSVWDWKRIGHAFNIIPKGGNVLEIGVGSGQLLNSLGISGLFREVRGVDIKRHSKFVELTPNIKLDELNIRNLAGIPDKSYDVVVCMEVLEHVDQETFDAGLSELRRVCRGVLLMTVPFEEPLPLPSFHQLRFERSDIDKYWPRADKYLLRGAGLPWSLMIEYMGDSL